MAFLLPPYKYLELKAISFGETVHATLHSFNFLHDNFSTHYRFALAGDFEPFNWSWGFNRFPTRLWILFCDDDIPMAIDGSRRAKVYELEWNEKGDNYLILNRYAAEFLREGRYAATAILYQTPPSYWDSYPLSYKEDWVLGGLRWLHSSDTPPLWSHIHGFFTIRLVFASSPPPWKPF